jgi:galactokinase
LTGAGWGGAVLVLVGPAGGAARPELKIAAAIRRSFHQRVGREPSISTISAGPGARRERVI